MVGKPLNHKGPRRNTKLETEAKQKYQRAIGNIRSAERSQAGAPPPQRVQNRHALGDPGACGPQTPYDGIAVIALESLSSCVIAVIGKIGWPQIDANDTNQKTTEAVVLGTDEVVTFGSHFQGPVDATAHCSH